MFTIITQDGRTICIDRKFTLFVSGYFKSSNQPAAVTVSTFDKATSDIVERFSVVAGYSTDTEFINASKALRRAWNNGEKSFTMPADFATRDRDEAFADFCAEHNLICVSVSELGYKPGDIPSNLHIWRTSDHFERQNILVADEDGSYETSLKKWKNLHKEALPA